MLDYCNATLTGILSPHAAGVEELRRPAAVVRQCHSATVANPGGGRRIRLWPPIRSVTAGLFLQAGKEFFLYGLMGTGQFNMVHISLIYT